MTQRAFRPSWDGNPAGFIPYGQHEDEFVPYFSNTSSGYNPPPPGINQPPSFGGFHAGGQNMPYMMNSQAQEMNGYYMPVSYRNGPMKGMGPPPSAQYHPPVYHQPRPPMYDPYSGGPVDSRFLSSTENIPPHSPMNFMQHPPFQRHSMAQPPSGGQFPDVGQWNAQPMGTNDNVWRDPDELRRKQEKLNGTQFWGNPEKQKSQNIRRWTDGDNKIAEQVEFTLEDKFERNELTFANPFAGDAAGENGELGWGDVSPLDKEKLNKIWTPHPAEMIGGPQRLSPDEITPHSHRISQRPVSMINPPTHPPSANMWANPTVEFNGADVQFNGNGMQDHVSNAYQAWQRAPRSPIQSPRLPNFDDSENFTSIPDLGCNVEHLFQEDRVKLCLLPV